MVVDSWPTKQGEILTLTGSEIRLYDPAAETRDRLPLTDRLEFESETRGGLHAARLAIVTAVYFGFCASIGWLPSLQTLPFGTRVSLLLITFIVGYLALIVPDGFYYEPHTIHLEFSDGDTGESLEAEVSMSDSVDLQLVLAHTLSNLLNTPHPDPATS